MDIWEANSISNAVTPHPCSTNGACTSDAACGVGDQRYNSNCDKDGCDFNPYRWNNKTAVSWRLALGMLQRTNEEQVRPWQQQRGQHPAKNDGCDSIHHQRQHRHGHPFSYPPPVRAKRPSDQPVQHQHPRHHHNQPDHPAIL